jgi:hypothetical protein
MKWLLAESTVASGEKMIAGALTHEAAEMMYMRALIKKERSLSKRTWNDLVGLEREGGHLTPHGYGVKRQQQFFPGTLNE